MPTCRSLFLVALYFLIACSSSAEDAIDAGPQPAVPIDPVGHYRARTTIVLAAPPEAVAGVLQELGVATDGPDDPSRYLIERMVESLPAGAIKSFAANVTPYLAAYASARISSFAPRFAPGVRALVDGLGRISQRFGLDEEIEIERTGNLRRTIVGLRFENVETTFAALGLPDVTAETSVRLDDDRLAVARHQVGIPYGRLIELGLDREVVPSVVPGASGLAQALFALVDCERLGIVVGEAIGIGSPELYRGACVVALTVAASKIYATFPRRDATPLVLELAGTARGIDLDRDGAMDAIADGSWAGTFEGLPIGASTFEGTAR